MMIKKYAMVTENYEMIFEDGEIKSTNKKTGDVFGEGYSLGITVYMNTTII
jgi:hypothetical protein